MKDTSKKTLLHSHNTKITTEEKVGLSKQTIHSCSLKNDSNGNRKVSYLASD